jgi:AraC-like DNA-binding protein
MIQPIDSAPSGDGRNEDTKVADVARYFRPAALPGVEVLHATFVAHRYAPHLHQAWTVAAVDDGAASFDLEGRRYTAPAGTVFVIPPHAVHTGEVASPDGFRYRVIYLDTESRSGTLPGALATRPRYELPVVMRHQVLAADLSRLHSSFGVAGRALEQGEMLASVTSELSRLVSDSPGHQHGPPHPGVARALAYIQDLWREDFALADLAEAARVSPFHLVRLFRQQTGMPPSAYRRALRVCAAQRMLRNGWPPAETAAECGFCDQSHLNRHFKLVTGVTPRQYALAGGP